MARYTNLAAAFPPPTEGYRQMPYANPADLNDARVGGTVRVRTTLQEELSETLADLHRWVNRLQQINEIIRGPRPENKTAGEISEAHPPIQGLLSQIDVQRKRVDEALNEVEMFLRPGPR